MTDTRPCRGDAYHQHPLWIVAPEDPVTCFSCDDYAMGPRSPGKCLGEAGYHWKALAAPREPCPPGWHEVEECPHCNASPCLGDVRSDDL